MKWLVGKYFFKSPGDRYYDSVHPTIIKILDSVNHEDGRSTLLVTDLLQNRVCMVPISSVSDYVICACTKNKDDIDVIHAKNYVFHIEDYYLHRIGGPAYIAGDKKTYYLFGVEYSKEEYLNVMPEDIQTKMCFEINKV